MTSGTDERRRLPVLRPLLPTAEALLPYLEQIDATRRYTNYGALVEQLESRLAAMFDVAPECVVACANGTTGLTQALLAATRRDGGTCVMPSWTFVATPAAAIAAGLSPAFCDVDPTTWALIPETAAREARDRRAAAIVPVSAFGAPSDFAAWDEVAADTGAAVVVDAAAAFDACTRPGVARIGRAPVMISLHATKALGIGEGAVVVARDGDLARRIRAFGNFGFFDVRRADVSGVNGKVSEYAAAVGLAALDGWQEAREQWQALATAYASALTAEGVRLSPGFGEGWISACAVAAFAPPFDAAAAAASLGGAGIDTRAWWGRGCHAEPAYAACPRSDLPVTEDLAARTLGLPFWRGMDAQDVADVASALANLRVEA